MKTSISSQLEEGIATSHKLTKEHHRSAVAMTVSAIVAYYVVVKATNGWSDLALSIAAATALTVGVCSAPSIYRSQSGSLVTAFGLVAYMWSVPTIIVLLSLI